ncbi:uncharacterized protein N7473_002738 [Penicillium subrubescens]|uniref:Uncharacterized protein n=1 Tax=Penicillium subrubescens TaxID=1316194 RepID=A0A1Q5UL03_9EURO|nr:uncharacterized protein N7473_002738 [Penicillium subrubescens]KAJ5905822.1 hypothetical protein N7473_002738 [Penicillium subrubescens]OKP13142.1 hypothetical protein PENSUB_1242 [Penicillium subrubescens]
MALHSKYHLRSEAGWTVWIGHIQAVAQMKDVWHYMDPNLPDESITKLPGWPEEPEFPDFARPDSDADIDSNLRKRLIDKYTRMVEEHKKKLHQHEHILDSLSNLNVLIIQTVSPTLRKSLVISKTPREKLVTLARILGTDRRIAPKKAKPRIPYHVPRHKQKEKNSERSDQDVDLGLMSKPWECRLRSQAQWMRWIRYIQIRASCRKMWPYIDPELSEDQVKKTPQRFEELKMPHPSDIKPGVQNEEDLEDGDYEKFTRLVLVYEIEVSHRRYFEENLSFVNELIVLSLAAEYHYLIADRQSPRDKLLRLAKLFRPKPKIHQNNIRNDWRKMMLSSPSKSNVEAWIWKWLPIYEDAKAAKVPEFSCGDKPPICDFLSAVLKTGPMGECFFLLWRREIEKEEHSFLDVLIAYSHTH